LKNVGGWGFGERLLTSGLLETTCKRKADNNVSGRHNLLVDGKYKRKNGNSAVLCGSHGSEDFRNKLENIENGLRNITNTGAIWNANVCDRLSNFLRINETCLTPDNHILKTTSDVTNTEVTKPFTVLEPCYLRPDKW
jgi:hypothetical protein